MAFMKALVIAIAILLMTLEGCSHSTQPENPEWVDQLIVKFQSEPVGDPPRSIWRYKHKGDVVYYIPAVCCDQYDLLYGYVGNVICAPDGGYSGDGDGRCPDFFAKRTDEKLVWRDPRIPQHGRSFPDDRPGLIQ
jgi:hypothetical protein